MKRSKGLVRLAREHHTALVLAKRAQRIDLKNVVAVHEYMAAAVDNFDRELGSHFQFEEDRLLPLMMKAGEAARVQRTVADHEELRQLIDRLRSQDIQSVRRFGDVLEAHIRFEDRDLFVVAESVLPPEVLASLERDEP